MNEHPKLGEPEYGRLPDEYVRSRRIGVEALERELHGETTDAVDISIYVKGRMIATTTDSATVERIMRILTGLDQ